MCELYNFILSAYERAKLCKKRRREFYRDKKKTESRTAFRRFSKKEKFLQFINSPKLVKQVQLVYRLEVASKGWIASGH